MTRIKRGSIHRPIRLLVYPHGQAQPREASPKYAGLEEDVKHLYDRIKAALPNEAADKLNELCDTYTEMAAMITELYYRQGFSDGVMVIMQAIMASG